jgi:hypothetical protein
VYALAIRCIIGSSKHDDYRKLLSSDNYAIGGILSKSKFQKGTIMAQSVQLLGYGLDVRSIVERFLAGVRDLALLSCHTGSGTHRAYSAMNTRGLLRSKQPELESAHSPSVLLRLRISESVTPPFHMLS